jgi:hypothetical protein
MLVCMSPSRVEIKPMTPVISDDTVEELTNRLALSRTAHFPDQGWQLGTPATWLEELIADWKDFDFSDFQARLGEMPHMIAGIGEQQVHFLHAVGTGPDPLPLVLTHVGPVRFSNTVSSCRSWWILARTVGILQTRSPSWSPHFPASASLPLIHLVA